MILKIFLLLLFYSENDNVFVLNIILLKLESSVDVILRLGGLFISILIPYLIREHNDCKKLESNQIYNSLGNTSMALGVSYGCMPLAQILSSVPVIGLMFSLMVALRKIPFVGEPLLWGIWFIPTYIILNVLNYSNGLDKYCGRKHHWILGLVGMILSFASYFIDNYLYFA